MAKKLSASFQQGKQRQTENGDITLDDKIKAELEALKDRSVDLSDAEAPEIENWDNAERGKFYRPIKQQITIRIDADILDWFKHQPGKYQSLINQACRDYMKRHNNQR